MIFLVIAKKDKKNKKNKKLNKRGLKKLKKKKLNAKLECHMTGPHVRMHEISAFIYK